MSWIHYFDSIMSVYNPEEAQICIPYKYMVKQLKSLNKSYFGSHLGCHPWFSNQKSLTEDR